MKGGARAALAIGVGYALGRRRKMRLATMLAIGAATGGAGKFGPVAMRRGSEVPRLDGSRRRARPAGGRAGRATSSPTVRGELLDASKAAAVAAVSSRIESLGDSLHDRAEHQRCATPRLP